MPKMYEDERFELVISRRPRLDRLFEGLTKFSIRTVPKSTTTKSSEKHSGNRRPRERHELFRIPKNELRRNRRTIKLRGNCRISNICGRLLSVRGKHSNGVTYSLLVDSGAAINIIKRNDVPKEVRAFPMKKYFVMEREKNYS